MRGIICLLGVAAQHFFQPIARAPPSTTADVGTAFAWQGDTPAPQWTTGPTSSGWIWKAGAFFSAFAAAAMVAQKREAPVHVATLAVDGGSAVSASLSKELRDLYKVRRMPLRTEDEVRISGGDHQDTEGKVIMVNRKKSMIQIEELTRPKTGGKPIPLNIRMANVTITKLKMDPEREAMLKRKGGLVSDAAPVAALAVEGKLIHMDKCSCPDCLVDDALNIA